MLRLSLVYSGVASVKRPVLYLLSLARNSLFRLVPSPPSSIRLLIWCLVLLAFWTVVCFLLFLALRMRLVSFPDDRGPNASIVREEG